MRPPHLIIVASTLIFASCTQAEPKSAEEALQVAEVQRELREWRKSYTTWYRQIAEHRALLGPGEAVARFKDFTANQRQIISWAWDDVEAAWSEQGGDGDDLKIYKREQLAKIHSEIDSEVANSALSSPPPITPERYQRLIKILGVEGEVPANALSRQLRTQLQTVIEAQKDLAQAESAQAEARQQLLELLRRPISAQSSRTAKQEVLEQDRQVARARKRLEEATSELRADWKINVAVHRRGSR